MIRYFRISVVGICAAALGWAADSVSVGGPVLGAVFDPRSHSIRQVTGVPGASLLGATLASGLDMAEVAPNGNTALALQGNQLYAISGLGTAGPAWIRIVSEKVEARHGESAPSRQSINRIVWSNDSSVAAVYSAAAQSIIVVSNISDGGIQQASITVDSLGGGDVTAFAVESSGNSVIVGVAGGLYLIDASTRALPVLLAQISRPAAVYLSLDKDLFVADADTLQVFEVRNYHGAAQLLPFANLPHTAPVALAVSPDGRFVFVADNKCSCVSVLDSGSGSALNQIGLDVEPEYLKPLSNGRLFQLNSPVANHVPFWMLSTGAAPTAYFVSGGAQ